MDSRKTYRDWKPKEYAEESVSPGEVLPEDDLVFFLIDVVRKLDLSRPAPWRCNGFCG